ncbi:hypothetical protein [Mesobacillus jeotgali]|uniref:DUF4878 domain-containing protein n=1 Tax=Mesobacillus jeotgali TaxID=129985 RepID=A0ABY9VTX0_9BACI|nr:hypothetical protein [Mesobacillus jeotgali]WNF24421.1 hypothetical protein RH061_08020 [Mesobacillus jeotgali]
MKKIFGIIAIMAGFSLLSAFILPGFADMLQSKKAAKHVLENLIEQNYETAFDGIHFYDEASDLAPTIPYEEAKGIWSERVRSLKEKGTYIVDYKNLSVELDDTYPIGTVDLVVKSDEKETLIKDVSLWFGYQDSKWGLGNLHFYTDQEEDLEQAVSGYVTSNEE